MSFPRNKESHERGMHRRGLIREIMLDHAREHPLAKPLTGEEIRRRLLSVGHQLAVSTILWHVEGIRREATSESECRNRYDSSTPDTSLR